MEDKARQEDPLELALLITNYQLPITTLPF
jgi:hypothetical protein